MDKNLKCFGFNLRYFGLVLLLLLGTVSPSVNAYLFRGTLGEMDMTGEEQYQRTFFSPYSNKFYMIFDHYSVAHGWSIVYSQSDYGITWSPALTLWNTSEGEPDYGANMGADNFDFYLEPDGRHIHFANYSGSNKGYYWKMEINQITGIITPITNIPQFFISGVGWGGSWRLIDEISITVDSNGYPYIGGEVSDGATQRSYVVWKSNFNNGTWLHEDFDYYHIESEYIANGGANPANYAWGGELHPSYDGNIICIYWYWNQPAGQQFHRSMYYDASLDDWIDCGGSIFNDNEGGDWAEDCWSTGYSLQVNISVMFKQKESNPNGVIGIHGIVLNHTTYTWGSSFQVSFNEVGDAGSTVFNPFVTVSNSGAVNFVWTIANNVTYWARRMYPDGTLESNWFVVEDMFNDMIEDNQFSVADTALAYSPMPMLMMDDIGASIDQDFIYFNYMDFLLGNWSVPFEYYNTTLYNSDDSINNGWLFMGEVYNLVTYIRNMTTFYLELDDGVNIIQFTYTDATKSLNVECNELVAGLVYANVETINATLEMYKLTWRFILNKGIVDVPSNGTITYYGENTPDGSYVSGTAITGLHIYNLGGHVSYDMQGDGARVIGGDWLEISQTNGTGATTGAYAETIYRRLQHVHVLWSLDVEDNACFDDDGNTGYVYMGIKYLNNLSDWVDGWYMRLRINKGAVDANDKAWITITVQWYARDIDGVVSLIGTSQYLSGYPECGDKVGADITRTRFYTDLWFNTANSSTTIGGRLNTYYFGMDKTGFLFWTGWSPIMLNMSESMMFTDLRDVNGDILNPSEIELMKFWVRVLKVSDGTCDAHTWSIRNPQISYQMADDRMGALNTPDGVETIIVDMPSTGWMQPIAKAIEGISNAIWAGALNFMKIMLGAVDSLLMFLNSPVSMSQMIQWIMLQASYITAWMVYVIEYVSSMLSVFSSMITVLSSIMTWAVNVVMWVLVDVIGFPIAVLAFFVQIMSGQEIIVFYDTTFNFSSVSGLITGAREVAPFGVGFMYMSWLFWGNISMDGEIDEGGIISRIMQTFGWFRTVYNDMFWIYNRMRNEIVSLYNFIRSHIPSLGGGGGEVDES